MSSITSRSLKALFNIFRKCEKINQNRQECQKIIFEKDEKKTNQEKTLEEKMRNAFSLFHANKSDEAIKAFTEIVKDKSVRY